VSVLTRKILPPIFGIATIGWIIGGTIWFDKQLSNNNTLSSSENTTPQSALVAQNQILPRSICFNSGSTTPIFYNENLVELHSTADFLVKNNNQSLILTGLSDDREAKNSRIDVGFARAEAVKTTLTKFGAPNNSLEVLSEQRAGLIDANNQVCDAVKMKFVSNTEGHFQALNLFFGKNKFRFSETADLQTYFSDLQIFLGKNPEAKLKIASHRSDTEGSRISENRLAFMTDFLKSKRFNSQQFIFEDKKTKAVSSIVSDVKDLTNQRIEIRILTP
jgi:hypothetical protein